MPVIKFDRVVSCSSEDPNHPAKNLLKTETYKKWKCKNPGEDQISVVLQLEKSSLISSVDIGNEHSAFVEILVSRSTGDAEDFKVLLVASSFMAPLEARNGEHPNRVRMFSRDQLSKPAVDERWDRVKVVCRQPFNRHVQYGLTFVKLNTSQQDEGGVDTAAGQHQTTLGRFVVRDDDPEDGDLRVGSLFAAKHGGGGGLLGGPHKPPPTGAAAIMDASKPAALASREQTARKQSPVVKTEKQRKKADAPADAPAEGSPRPQKAAKEPHKNGMVAASSSTEKVVAGRLSPAPKRVKLSDGAAIAADAARAGERRASPPASGRSPAAAGPGDSGRKARTPAPTAAAPTPAPFHRLLGGVTLVISGYQNPLRANLREAALQMGARYRPDWGPGCTHLVCAFPNTPKFNQVKGHGKIVRKEWIEDCHSQRKRLPWRRYAMDKKDQVGPESDTEEESESVEVSKEQHTVRAPSPSPSGESTDDGDDAERTPRVDTPQPSSKRPSLFAPLDGDGAKQSRSPPAARQKGGRAPPPPRPPTTSFDPYDADTDVDDDGPCSPAGADLPPLPELPDLFRGATFRLGPSLPEETRERLERYITAYGGEVVSSVESANYLVAGGIKDCERVKFDRGRCTAVRPAWVWACNDARRLVPADAYELE